MFWKVLLTTLSLTLSSIQIQPEKQITQISLRIGEYKQITIPPTFNFQNIYSKQVFSLDENNNQNNFSSVCQQTPADIVFNQGISFLLNISQSQKNQDILINFEDIKADRRILDTVLFKDKAYLLLRQNVLQIYKLQSHYLGSQSKTIPSINMDKGIQMGYFVQIKNTLLLITPFEAFKIQQNNITRLQGYENISDFQSARQLFDSYFSVCGINSGIIIYSLEGNVLTKRSQLNAQFFSRSSIFISDLAYHAQRSQIFVSDLKFGINIIQIDTSKPNLDPYLLTSGYRKVGCSVIVFVEGNLYASCDSLFKVRYDSDGIIIQMPSPMFRVKQLLIHKGLIVAVGEDLITKYYNDKLAYKNPQYDGSQRLIFYGFNKYLRVNYYQLQVGTFKILYPSIVCHTNNITLEGIMNAVLKTQAQCSQSYFDKYQIKHNTQITKFSTCMYTSPIQFNFWKSQQFSFELLFIIMGLLFLVAGIITIWVICMFAKQLLLKRNLDMYSNPNIQEMRSGTNMPGYNVMVEEKENTQQNNVSDTGKGIESENGTHSID